MSDISKLTELRKLMLSMEQSLGLKDLSPAERDVFCAASELAHLSGTVQTTGLKNHALVVNIARPTFFRALRSLVAKGYLSSCEKSPRGQYRVNDPDT